MSDIEILTLKGAALEPWLNDVAELRIRVFRDFPYLYDGSLAYETEYLRTYIESDTAICVLARSGDQVVGASTGLALDDETEAFKRPFLQAGMDTRRIFYCAESILLPDYRGSGIYREFFSRREQQALHLGKSICAFCAVQRPDDHPLKPAGYQPLEQVWQHFGYRPRPDLITSFSWKDVGEPEQTDKPMQFYLKPLS